MFKKSVPLGRLLWVLPWALGSPLAAEPEGTAPTPPLTITRIIPGNHTATIEWLRPQSVPEDSDVHYSLQVRLRIDPCEPPTETVVKGTRTSATLTGLLNNADYVVTVSAVQRSNSRVLARSPERFVTPGDIPGIVIDYLHKGDPAYAPKGQYIGSPSIARLPDGQLVAGHDFFGKGGSQDYSRVFRSDDRGRTWHHVSDVAPAFWGKLFVHRSKLYLLACRNEYADLLLHESPDGGVTWRQPVVVAAGRYHKAPVPVVAHAGRLWTCVEQQTGGWPAGFQALALSVSAESDIRDPRNWTVGKPLPYDPAWAPKGWATLTSNHGFLEGNAVVDPQGRLLNILRYHVSPHFKKAIALTISQEDCSLSFNRLIDFHGGMTKFTIRRHPETGVYWSLVNRVTDPAKPAMRSVLTLVASADLNEWTAVRDILRDDRETAPQYTGFQYIDWLFDDEDIVFVSRTAYNGAHNYHDANHLTFHRIPDFARGFTPGG
jgi:hypothetical protein